MALTQNQAHVANRINQLSEEAQRSLGLVAAEAEAARKAMHEGLRPQGSPGMIGRTVASAVEAHARLEAMVEAAGVVGVPKAIIEQAYKGRPHTFWVGQEA